jgi:hypothetical protein
MIIVTLQFVSQRGTAMGLEKLLWAYFDSGRFMADLELFALAEGLVVRPPRMIGYDVEGYKEEKRDNFTEP